MGTPGVNCFPPVKWPMTGCSSAGKFMTPAVVGCWRTPTEEVVWQPFRLTMTSTELGCDAHPKPRMAPVIVQKTLQCEKLWNEVLAKSCFGNSRIRDFYKQRKIDRFMWAWWKFICSQKKSFPDTTVARIQLGLANECIWWHIFIFMQLGLLRWKHIYSSLHLLAFLFLFPLEIKWCKVSVALKSAKIYKVDCLITDAQDWTKWNLCPILHIWLELSMSRNDSLVSKPLMAVSVVSYLLFSR